MATPEELAAFAQLLEKSSLGSAGARRLASRATREEIAAALSEPSHPMRDSSRPEVLLQRLIDELGKLPGGGAGGAKRMSLHILKSRAEDLARLSDALEGIRQGISRCRTCGYLAPASGDDVCSICQDPRRDPTTIYVVETVMDVLAKESEHDYRGLYHVLSGAISPIAGVGPDDLNVGGLLSRLHDAGEKMVIIATGFGLEGEATATYLGRVLTDLTHVQVLRQTESGHLTAAGLASDRPGSVLAEIENDSRAFSRSLSSEDNPLMGRLSARELAVMKLLAKGLTTDEVANQLRLPRTSVRMHASRALRKVDVKDRKSLFELLRKDEPAEAAPQRQDTDLGS